MIVLSEHISLLHELNQHISFLESEIDKVDTSAKFDSLLSTKYLLLLRLSAEVEIFSRCIKNIISDEYDLMNPDTQRLVDKHFESVINNLTNH